MRVTVSPIFALLIALIVFIPPPALSAGADHADYARRLDQFFGQLHSTTDAYEAKQIENKIRLIWSSNSTDDAVHQLSVASLALQVGDFKVAGPILDQLVKDQPDFAEAWNRRATLYYVEGKYEESLADIDKVLALEPRHFGAVSGKGACLRALGRDAEALQAMKDAVAIDPFIAGLSDAIKEMQKKTPEL